MPTSLNQEQQQAVTHGEGPLLIIAGAGTGKTTVITKRIAHLIQEQKISPGNILALTFTEKAATEMQTRIDEALPYGYIEMWIETFHAFCDRILRAEAINIGLDPKFSMLTEAEALAFLRKHLFSFELDYFRPLGNPNKFLQGMLQHFSRLKDDDINPEQYLSYAEGLMTRHSGEQRDSGIDSGHLPASARRWQAGARMTEIEKEGATRTMELAKAYTLYEDLKVKEGVMDFSDLISNTLKLFRMRKTVLKEYQKKFHYVLVDEFQDTNYAQNELAMLLSGERQNITVVGDDDQAIYRWRGAAISNMLQFRAHFPNTTIVTLTKNYRSTQTILDSAYQMIQHNNPDRLEIKENINKQLTAMKSKGMQKDAPIEFIYTNRVEEEAENVAKKIKEIVKKTNRLYNDFAILVRANDHATPFQRALERVHIPFQFLGPGHLFQQEEIKDLIAYLHTLVNFEDTSALYRVLTMPVFAIAARDIAALLNFSKRNNITLFEAMEQVEESLLTDDGKIRITRIVEMLKKHLEKVPTETAGQILYYFFEDSGLLGHYLDPGTIRTEREAENIAKFFDRLNSFAANKEDASIFVVVDWIDLSMELGESPQAALVDWSTNNAVNILTIHSSKGLEFPVVFVVNLVTQRFPSRDRKEQIPVPQGIIRETLPEGDSNLQEERRLFYVAITRAKEQLFLTAAKFYGEGKRERKLAPFIGESLGQPALDKVLRKHVAEQAADQLSLLDMFNTQIAPSKKEEAPKQDTPIYPVTYLSYSQIQTFLTCPLHYKLKYILNVPTQPTPALSYGVSIHSSLRDFSELLKTNASTRPNQMHELLKKNWLSGGYNSKAEKEQAYKRATTTLLSYADELTTNSPQTIAIELPFAFWIDLPAGRQGKLKVGGRIDRIDKLPNGRIEIIDYKTGSKVPEEKKLRDDLQLTFYALAATEMRDDLLGKTPEEIVLTLNYLEVGKIVSTTRTKDELEIAKGKIAHYAEDISRSAFVCTGGIFCKSCEYQMLCSTYR
ncbi:MAG: ATP-dependent DNA helicase [Patescibacteria group bacterium]